MTYPIPEFVFPLGAHVHDKVTGLEGIITTIEQRIGINLQYTVQPMGDGKTNPEAWSIDHYTLEQIDEGVSASLPPMDELKVQLGMDGFDQISKAEGVITTISYNMNGCILVSLGLPYNPESKHIATSLTIPQNRFVENPMATKAYVATDTRGPGGPVGKPLRF